MAFARERHVQLATESYSHRSPGLPGADRRNCGIRAGLDLLASERATHAQTLHDDAAAGEAQHPRDNLLRP